MVTFGKGDCISTASGGPVHHGASDAMRKTLRADQSTFFDINASDYRP